MNSHQPSDYTCPLCYIAQGIEGNFPYTKQADIVYKDDQVTAVIASHWWPKNAGHVVIFPNAHHESLYTLPTELVSAVHTLSSKLAKTIKATYNCDGITILQNNEPAGGQEVWHYHMHVIPRYAGDNWHENYSQVRKSEPSERLSYVAKIKSHA